MTDRGPSESRYAGLGPGTGGSSRSASPDRPDRDLVPDDLVGLDDDLSRLLGPSGVDSATASRLVERVVLATAGDLPPRILPFEDQRTSRRLARRFIAGFGGIAAAIAVAALALTAIEAPSSPATERTMASAPLVEDDPMAAMEYLETRDSERMLVAVLEPDAGWFDDEEFDVGFDAESVLRSRSMDLDDLEGMMVAMLGRSAS